MKKQGTKLLLIITLLLALLLTGCGGKAEPEQTSLNSAPAVTVVTAAPAAEATTPEPEEIPVQEQSEIPEETSAPEQSEIPEETSVPAQSETSASSAPEQTAQPSETTTPSLTADPSETPQITQEPKDDPDMITVEEDGEYSDKEHVALYIHTYGHLPSNFVTKEEAKAAGWDSGAGNLVQVLPGKSIGGDRFGNYEGLLPKAKGRQYYECDINFNPKGKTSGRVTRGSERIIYSNDGLIFYTGDHYNTFEQLY